MVAETLLANIEKKKNDKTKLQVIEIRNTAMGKNKKKNKDSTFQFDWFRNLFFPKEIFKKIKKIITF